MHRHEAVPEGKGPILADGSFLDRPADLHVPSQGCGQQALRVRVKRAVSTVRGGFARAASSGPRWGGAGEACPAWLSLAEDQHMQVMLDAS